MSSADHIDPFVNATIATFSTMLDCELEQSEALTGGIVPSQSSVNGIICLTGKATGRVVLSLDERVALAATGVLLLETPQTVTEDVKDAVGELTNMIAGQAKAKLDRYELSLALPQVVVGGHLGLPADLEVNPVSVPFTSPWGSLSIEVRFA